MLRYPFAETQMSPLLLIEASVAQNAYDTLHTRYMTAADVIVSSIMTTPIRALISEDKDPDRRRAVNWRLDGKTTDGQFDFATRVAVDVYCGPDHKRPETISNTRYEPSPRWKYLAGEVGRAGLYALSIEARTVDLKPMEEGETTYESRDHAKFFAKFLGEEDEEIGFKANPEEDEPLIFTPLRPFQSVLDTAYSSFLAKHAPDIVPENLRQLFAEATARDYERPDYTHDSIPRYHRLAKGVPDSWDRIKRLASALYAANDNATSGELLAELLNPGVVETANLARLNSPLYYSQKNRQIDKTTIYNRLGWVGDQALHVQANARSIIGPDAEGFEEALLDELRTLTPIVNGLEMLQEHLQIPETIPVNDPDDWRVYDAL